MEQNYTVMREIALEEMMKNAVIKNGKIQDLCIYEKLK